MFEPQLIWDGLTLARAPLCALILSFAFYAFIGWVWESTVCAMLNHKSFANSGFLLGPCCPIYGVGALACWVLLHEIPGKLELFLWSMVVCDALEYATGWALERIAHTRFWDYTKYPFNLHGRICLYGALLFGVGAVVICRAVQPALLGVMDLLPAWMLEALSVLTVVGIAVDTVLSLASWRRLSRTLENLRADLAERINDNLRGASDSLLDRAPADLLDDLATAQMRSHAVNGWLSTASDAVMDALRERFALPSFVVDGRDGLRLALTRLRKAAPAMPSMPSVADAAERLPHRPRRVHMRLPRSVRPLPRVSLRRRDLRFFNAFPNLRILPYEGVIRATGLKDRARELFRR